MATSWFRAVCALLVAGLALVAQCAPEKPLEGTLTDEERAKAYLEDADVLLTDMCLRSYTAEWNYANNLTEHNKNKSVSFAVSVHVHFSVYDSGVWSVWKLGGRRWPGRGANIDRALVPCTDYQSCLKCLGGCSRNTVNQHVCLLTSSPNHFCDFTSDHQKKKKNECQVGLWQIWQKPRAYPGKLIMFGIISLLVILSSFEDASGMWQNVYEYDGFEETLHRLWLQLEPLYKELHAYVRSRLRERYGNKIKEDGPIPGHLLGNIHAQDWSSLNKFTEPYAGKPTVDVTDAMKEKNMTAKDMFLLSEEFFTSLGLPPMPKSFWEKSVLTKPTNREIICHASAWDFCGTSDVRIKQCTQVKMDDLLVVHHEMGHVEYFLKYAKQPYFFRNGANPGFHEAIGDTMALSVSTPKHLKAIGLLKEDPEDAETEINYLYSVALDKVSVMPSTYIYDLWRWNVFKGKYKPEDYNKGWWDLLLQYQGICPGVARSSEDFDPPSKYHISANVPYIRYFVSTVLQFQFYKALCEEAGHVGPLHQCDFYQSKEAGKLFGDVLELGQSKPWPEVLGMLTKGKTKDMDAGPLMEYFEPLLKWLRNYKGKHVGWKSEDSTSCPKPLPACRKKL
ncbi:unnamed protein product [Ixodes hexagonus]